MTEPGALYEGVELLSLDAGNVVLFFDHARLAEVLRRFDFVTDAEALVRAEGIAKKRHAAGTLESFEWSHMTLPGARGWGALLGTWCCVAGVRRERLPELVEALWDEHGRLNFWSRLPDGFDAAMERVRKTGIKTALVSNSEGVLERLFERLGIRKHFDVFVDSGVVGVEKPDPAIFRIMLERAGTPANAALHVGDTVSTDIVGAQAAGLRTALLDPFGHYDGEHPDLPRVESVVAVADALVRR